MDGIISVLRPPRYADPTPPQKMRPMCRTGSGGELPPWNLHCASVCWHMNLTHLHGIICQRCGHRADVAMNYNRGAGLIPS